MLRKTQLLCHLMSITQSLHSFKGKCVGLTRISMLWMWEIGQERLSLSHLIRLSSFPCCFSTGCHQGVLFGLTVKGKGEEGVWSEIVATSWSRGGWGIRRLRPSSRAPSPAWAKGSGWSGRRLRVPSRTSPLTRQTGTTASAWWCAAAHLQGVIKSKVIYRAGRCGRKWQWQSIKD